MVTKFDWDVIFGVVRTWQKDPLLANPSRAFVAASLNALFGLEGSELISCITDGGGDRGVDALFIEQSLVGPRVHILQCKLQTEHRNQIKNFPGNQVDKTVSFLLCLFDETILTDTGCHPVLLDKCREIVRLMQSTPVIPVSVHYCSTGSKLTPEDRARLGAAIQGLSHVELVEHDCADFVSLFTRPGAISTKKTLHFDGGVTRHESRGIRAIVGTVKALDLINVVADARHPTVIDRTLFEDNVRLFLGQKNLVNQQIIKTASSPQKSDFWFLNNGLTIVCDSIQMQLGRAKSVAELTQPQIVNGGQTSYALFELGSVFREQVSDVSVFVKVIETSDADLRQRIAIATNSQTSIRGRDLRSNDLFQIQIEKALRRRGLYYERKRDQYSSKPIRKRIDALKAGQAILAYYKAEPDKAKTQSDRIFGELYSFVFDQENLDESSLLTAINLLKTLEARRDAVVQSMRSQLRKDYSEHWLVEGIFHALFMVGQLCNRIGADLTNYDEASKHIDEAVRIVGDYFAHSRAAAYRVFRSAQTKALLGRFEVAQQLPLDLSSSSEDSKEQLS